MIRVEFCCVYLESIQIVYYQSSVTNWNLWVLANSYWTIRITRRPLQGIPNSGGDFSSRLGGQRKKHTTKKITVKRFEYGPIKNIELSTGKRCPKKALQRLPEGVPHRLQHWPPSVSSAEWQERVRRVQESEITPRLRPTTQILPAATALRQDTACLRSTRTAFLNLRWRSQAKPKPSQAKPSQAKICTTIYTKNGTNNALFVF